MSFICQFCEKVLASKYILTKHQKTTKKCLDIQNQINNGTLVDIYECKYCSYTTTRTENFDRHSKSCLEKHREVIEKYNILLQQKEEEIKSRDEEIRNFPKTIEKINLQNDKTISELKLEIVTLRTKLECQTETSIDLKKMVMKSRQNNTQYITNQQRIDYSKANLQSYDELKNNISTIINSKFNKTTFQTIENVATFITNDLLNYNKKEYYHCFDIKGSIFHKKNGDEIDVDEKAEKLLNDILPTIIEKSRKIYIEESDTYNDKNTESKEDDNNLLLLSKALKNVRNISKRGSDERNLCIRRIASCYCVSSNQLKSYFNPKGEDIITID